MSDGQVAARADFVAGLLVAPQASQYRSPPRRAAEAVPVSAGGRLREAADPARGESGEVGSEAARSA